MESKNRTDRMLHANVAAFEAALSAGKEQVVTPQWPKTYLGVLDGSNQDATTVSLLASMAERYGGSVLLTAGVFAGAAERDEEAALDPALALLSRRGIVAEGVLSDRPESHERILAVLARRGAGLCALPCPFGHDLDEVGGTTLGTAVEVTLARASVPVLVVRGPADAAQVLERPHLVVAGMDAASARAARLGLGVLTTGDSPEGTLALTFVRSGPADADADAAAARGWAASPDDLIPLLADGLSSVLHRLMLLAEATPGLRVETRIVAAEAGFAGDETARGRLHILPLAREEGGISEVARAFVLSTLDPVLVVPA